MRPLAERGCDERRRIALKRRVQGEFEAAVSPYLGPEEYVALSLWATYAQQFLNLLVPGPLGRDDDLARHIVGRGADLTIEDDPWAFEAVAGLESNMFVEMRAG
ncbi:MAG: hypothetical protein LC798_07960, partial [Chloroflexi bacterium]|nr:hypothetical protein [Chloroflexota bacterium]